MISSLNNGFCGNFSTFENQIHIFSSHFDGIKDFEGVLLQKFFRRSGAGRWNEGDGKRGTTRNERKRLSDEEGVMEVGR